VWSERGGDRYGAVSVKEEDIDIVRGKRRRWI